MSLTVKVLHTFCLYLTVNECPVTYIDKNSTTHTNAILLNIYITIKINKVQPKYFQLTFGSNFKEEAVKKAARPSFKTIANPPISGEYFKCIMYVFSSTIGIAENKNIATTQHIITSKGLTLTYSYMYTKRNNYYIYKDNSTNIVQYL